MLHISKKQTKKKGLLLSPCFVTVEVVFVIHSYFLFSAPLQIARLIANKNTGTTKKIVICSWWFYRALHFCPCREKLRKTRKKCYTPPLCLTTWNLQQLLPICIDKRKATTAVTKFLISSRLKGSYREIVRLTLRQMVRKTLKSWARTCRWN